MTTTANTKTRGKAKPTAAVAPASRGELEWLDPRSLVIGSNVRIDRAWRTEFVASIREHGVQQPITAYRADDGSVVVVTGQRRTLAAVETDRPDVPVFVVAQPDDTDRILQQLTENGHRAPVTDRDESAAYAQLAAFGVTADQIARRASVPRAAVDRALTVSGSELAAKALDRYDFLTIDHAVTLVEFEGDDDAVKELVVAAQSGRGFDHAAQRLRDARAHAAARGELVEAVTAQGITIVDPGASARLDYLLQGGVIIAPDAHADCPGHVAEIVEGWTLEGLPGTTTKAEDYEEEDDEDEDDPDEDDEDDEDDDQRRQVWGWLARYGCSDYAAHGHDLRYPSSTQNPKPAAADMTDEARQKAAAERRDVIQSNKDWDSAEKVRREWLTQFVAGSRSPVGTAAFVATSMAMYDGQGEVSSAIRDGNTFACTTLGLADDAKYPAVSTRRERLADLISKASGARAQVIMLALVLCAYEASLSRDSWRHHRASAVWYLEFLAANGYERSAVEIRACSHRTANTEASAG